MPGFLVVDATCVTYMDLKGLQVLNKEYGASDQPIIGWKVV